MPSFDPKLAFVFGGLGEPLGKLILTVNLDRAAFEAVYLFCNCYP